MKESLNHKIEDSTISVNDPSGKTESKIEETLFNFESQEMQFNIEQNDYESVSTQSNLCYENQINCSDKTGLDKKVCLEDKIVNFLKCHGYKIKQNEECLLGSKHLITKANSKSRVVSVCFDHPLFNNDSTTSAQIPKRALHLDECQSPEKASIGNAWKSANQLINIYDIRFNKAGLKILDLAQESEQTNLGITDACGEPQQARFLKLNLELLVN